jgi:HD superfamily phosphohydrolase
VAGLSRSARKLAKEVSEFADRYLGDPHFPRAPKIIHDAIWGTQGLYKNEVAILDTPLLQRLRHIHQTGFTYLTYPSVTHTRFDHTLGVLYQADKLARALLDKYEERNDKTTIDRQSIRRLRAAALLHDCSHGPFSHTSEEYYSTFPEIQEYIGANGTQFEGSSASEVLAHLIITSEPFGGFLEKLESEVSLGLEADWLAHMITGQLKKSLNHGHYQLILNGPFDADKLDYIFRDGHYSGLPLGVDLDRLYLKTEIHVIRPENAPKKSPIFTEPMRRLVMARPGINSLEQIVAARMNLTASLYHHHKIRACDCMLKGLFHFCRENGRKLCGRYIESAADFLHFTDYKILSESERTKDRDVAEMLSNIVNRRLYKRTLVLSMNSFERREYEEETDEAEKEDLNRVHKLIDLPFKDQRRLAEEIWRAAGRPGRKEEVWLDFPKGPKTKDLADTFVNVGSIESPLFRTLEQFIPIDQWQKQYLQQKWRGHVFCRPEHVLKVSSAAADVLSQKYKIKFTDFAWTHANLDPPRPSPSSGPRTAKP